MWLTSIKYTIIIFNVNFGILVEVILKFWHESVNMLTYYNNGQP